MVAQGRIKLPFQLRDQITFAEHDFFTSQPVKDASVYFFRYTIHDWSDTYAIRILKALVPALTSESKVLINEHILPEPGTVSAYMEKHFR